MRKILGVVTALSFLSVLCGLFGCGSAPKYSAEDITAISITCGHMDYSYSYSFYLRSEDLLTDGLLTDGKNWLLDADFAVDSKSPHTEYERCSVAAEDVRELLNIVREQELIEKLRRWKEPKLKLSVSDETTFYSSILFADGTQLGAPISLSNDVTEYFYRIAKKYADRPGEAP